MNTYPFAKKKLPYPCDGLAPQFDPDTVYLHYEGIYAYDVDMLNYLLEQNPRLQRMTLEQLTQERLNQVPAATANKIRHYAGSIYNHEFFFEALDRAARCNGCGGELARAIADTYGSADAFRDLFFQAAGEVLGSGWLWLVTEGEGRPHIVITRDNGVPDLSAVTPVLVADLWEHAYFLRFGPQVEQYMENWFQAVNWEIPQQRYRRRGQGQKI